MSVLIVNYNTTRLLNAALEGLSKQTYRDFSTLVIDNGSTESPDPRAISAAGARLESLKRNLGFAAANNFGVRCSKEATWIALLNPDAIPKEDWLEKLLAAAARAPGVACFASRMLQHGRAQYLDGAGDVYHVSGMVWRRGHNLQATTSYLRSQEVFSPCAAAALYRRDVFEAVGGFDEDFFCYTEDVDLGFRLRLMGHKCLYVPEAIVYHVGSATMGKDSDFAVYHGHRNLVWTYVKNMPAPLFWIFMPLHIAANIWSVIIYSLKGRGRIILKAKSDAIKGLPKLWPKRREIQSRRVVTGWKIWKVIENGWPRRNRI